MAYSAAQKAADIKYKSQPEIKERTSTYRKVYYKMHKEREKQMALALYYRKKQGIVNANDDAQK